MNRKKLFFVFCAWVKKAVVLWVLSIHTKKHGLLNQECGAEAHNSFGWLELEPKQNVLDVGVKKSDAWSRSYFQKFCYGLTTCTA